MNNDSGRAPRRIVVTGAAGMLGQNLIPRLLAKGDRVVALDKNAAALGVLGERATQAEIHDADLAEEGDWSSRFAGVDAVVDLKAQITSADRALHLRNNAEATERVVRACERHGVPHLVYLSSSVVISKANDFYSESKRRGETAVRKSSAPHTILRPPLMFGPGDIKHLGLILGLMTRLPVIPIPGDGRFMRQPLYVGDMCAVIERVLERTPAGDIFNIIGHERIPFVDLLREIRRVRGLANLFVPFPHWLFRLALRTQRALMRRTIFTKEQLDALTAGDDFPIDPWTETFGVPYSTFGSMAPKVYGENDDLRVALLRANQTAGR
ncbi:MAG: NAD-dependent epimerase/dehydratase family protein [Vicinamibacteria bacterium]|nr:NAD-dependent epimerase/dehydratase family protein [Vicinamibacteria bacterium]